MESQETQKSAFVDTRTFTRTVETDIGKVRIDFRKRTQKIRVEAVVIATDHYKSLTGKDGYTLAVYQDECAKRMLQGWDLKIGDPLQPITPVAGWGLLDPDTNVRDKLLLEMGIKTAEITPDADAKNSQPGEDRRNLLAQLDFDDWMMVKKGLVTVTYGDWREMDDETKSRFLGFEEGYAEVRERVRLQERARAAAEAAGRR